MPKPGETSVPRGLRTALAACVLLTLTACHPALAPIDMHSAVDLRGERARFLHSRQGAAWLKRHYRVVVGSSHLPGRATSHWAFHGVLTRYSAFGAGSEVIRLFTPEGATPTELRARVVHADAIRELTTLTIKQVSGKRIDPLQVIWETRAPTLQPGEILEYIVEFEVPGTLTSDAQPLASPEGDTAELLFSYHVPVTDAGAFQVVGQKSGGIVAKKGDYSVIGLLLSGITKSSKRLPYARYVTRQSAPLDYVTDHASHWKTVGAAYRKELVDRSPSLRRKSAVPFTTLDLSRVGIETLARWVRDRIQQPHAYDARWNAGRPLAEVLVNNDLSAVDKVHLLHWLLEASGLAHQVVIARSKDFPRFDPKFPVPMAFDTPLIFIEAYTLWLDPGCQSCAPGQVRANLQGQPALLLNGPNEGQVRTITAAK